MIFVMSCRLQAINPVAGNGGELLEGYFYDLYLDHLLVLLFNNILFAHNELDVRYSTVR